MRKAIKVSGAREHNLRNISLEIPRNIFCVLTGVSGSGKSSLAFDTIYAEGQRRYVESLSTHARQFLNQMKKPDVDAVEGLSPSISIHQRVAFGSPRSTVGTTTEIFDYLRILFARIGIPHCPQCGKIIDSQSPQEIVNQIARHKDKKCSILSPIVRSKKGTFKELLDDYHRSGFTKARIDGKLVSIDAKVNLRKAQTHDIDILIDILTVSEENTPRIAEAVRTALDMGNGNMILTYDDQEVSYSETNACTECEISLGTLTPGMFSFNSPYGACELCHGLGEVDLLDPSLMIVDEDLSINQGAIPLINIEDVPMVEPNRKLLDMISKKFAIDLDQPLRLMSTEKKEIIFHGHEDAVIRIPYFSEGRQKFREEIFQGFCSIFFERFNTTDKTQPKDIIKRYMSPGICPDCRGKRLKKESLAVKINDWDIMDLSSTSIEKLLIKLKKIKLSELHQTISQEALHEIIKRLTFLSDVGLNYLTLSRKSNTLGGGEAQRIKLATQIGSGLMGVLYVLDEPTIGLHPRDVDRLLKALEKLKKLGNSVLVVEHDAATIMKADHIVELGPGAGVHGGRLLFNGPLKELLKIEGSPTADYLNGNMSFNLPKKRRPVNPQKLLKITGCSENNLKNISVQFPLGVFIAVTGVSGSGKSTLVNKTLCKALQKTLSRTRVTPGKYSKLTGLRSIKSAVEITQSPIGRTPRSNPATYTGAFDLIRDWFAGLPEAKIRGFKPSHFSFNVRGGRCEACSGDGVKKIEMHFLPNVQVPCEVCRGKRYNEDILAVKYHGKTISDVLETTVEESLKLFRHVKPIFDKLKLLQDVGLSYIKLGQSATTLSGGEAQRVKLAAELGQKVKGKSVYILDEPTTGLHMADIEILLKVLQRLVDQGHTVIVIEHNEEVIASCDWIIDLGPEGGEKGGTLVAEGTPEEISKIADSYTGQFLKSHLNNLQSFKK